MDLQFEQLWRRKSGLFAGNTISLESYLPLSDLRVLIAIVIHELFSADSQGFFMSQDDWHGHDGYLSEACEISYDDISSLSLSDANLRTACTNESYVRKAYFPDSREYNLRIYIPESEDNPFQSDHSATPCEGGIFDVTCEKEKSRNLLKALSKPGIGTFIIIPASDFFDYQYAG